jgi:hypothetical protein
MRLLTLLVLAYCAVTFGSGAFITYSNCTDRVRCSSSTCKTQTVPQGSCVAAGPAGSQVLMCEQYALLCLVSTHYADAKCAKPTSTVVQFCDTCYQTGNSSSPLFSPRCLISDSGTVVAEALLCGPKTNSSTCKGCSDGGQDLGLLPAGVCLPNNGKWNMVNQIVPCTGIIQILFATPDCSGKPIAQNLLPQRLCEQGSSFMCHS